MTYGNSNQIPLRDLWPNEALDFTPWMKSQHLVEDIARRLQVFQNPLKSWKTEVPCGNYRMDMIYKEQHGNGALIVENQYEDSDSKHLGQIIVYSQLTGISKILWISERVGNEHRRISKVLNGVQIIPAAVEIHGISDGYILNIHIYDKYNEMFSYLLDKDRNIICKKA